MNKPSQIEYANTKRSNFFRLGKSEIHKSYLKLSKKEEIKLLYINENKPTPFKRLFISNFIEIKRAIVHSHSDINFKHKAFDHKRLKSLKLLL